MELGWADGHNARLDVRWTAGSVDAARKYAAELVALAPDVIITDTSFNVAAVQQVTRTVPIVFGGVIDPVGAGLVDSLARPGGNTTGFTAFEYAIGAKWLELLKEVAPRVTRAAVLRDPTIAAGVGQFAAIQATAPFGIELSAVGLHDAGAIEPAVAAFAGGANGGLVMTARASDLQKRRAMRGGGTRSRASPAAARAPRAATRLPRRREGLVLDDRPLHGVVSNHIHQKHLIVSPAG
jgi:putative tryptophan/tyrosine transport system substrate-binding protein